jgi:hypothetical protein
VISCLQIEVVKARMAWVSISSAHEAMQAKLQVKYSLFIYLFRRKPLGNQDIPEVHMDNKVLPYNANPRVLGAFLDEELNFDHHIDKTEQKANKALSLLRAVKETEKVNCARLIQLYKAIVIPHLEYAAPVWQASPIAPNWTAFKEKPWPSAWEV